jgi:ribosome-associated protein
VVLDVRAVSSIADFFVLVTGSSMNHLRAIAKRVQDAMAESGASPDHVDGAGNTSWIVLDYGSVIVHAMLEEPRRFYELERLWGDAPVLALEQERFIR